MLEGKQDREHQRIQHVGETKTKPTLQTGMVMTTKDMSTHLKTTKLKTHVHINIQQIFLLFHLKLLQFVWSTDQHPLQWRLNFHLLFFLSFCRLGNAWMGCGCHLVSGS